MANTLMGMAILAWSSGGALVDWLGFSALFGQELVAMLVAIGITVSIREPRAEQIGALRPETELTISRKWARWRFCLSSPLR